MKKEGKRVKMKDEKVKKQILRKLDTLIMLKAMEYLRNCGFSFDRKRMGFMKK